MRATMLSLAAAAACLTFAVGCSQNSHVVRGQQPEYGTPVVSGDYCEIDDDSNCRHGHGCHCSMCQPYCVPNDLVYPPPGDQPAIVQYPYYTTKGPDCFFHQ
jgi:hypothetical protein